MPRSKRKWYKRKTNWGIAMFVLPKLLALYPPTAVAAPIVMSIIEIAGAALATYGIADRAGKANEVAATRNYTVPISSTTLNTTPISTPISTED